MSYLLYSQAEQLKLSEPVPVTLHPAAVYLSSLSEGSRRAMLSSLNAIARVAGWLAHWKEQLGVNRIFRPTQVYTGEHNAPYIPMEER